VSFLSDVLYESEYESQLWMIFDSNKQMLATGDAFPNQYSVKLEKGDYTLKLQVRHEKRDLLDRLKDLIILVHHKLATSITLDTYRSQAHALTGARKFSCVNLPPGHICPVYVAPLPDDKLPKSTSSGHFLSGTLTLAKDELGKKADTITFKYTLPESPKKTKSNGATKNKDKDKEKTDKEKTKEDEYAEALRDLKITWIPKLDDSSTLYEELKKDHDGHVPLHVARLHALDVEKDRTSRLGAVIESSQNVIKLIDETALLTYYGMKSDTRPDAITVKTEMDKQKGWLLDALVRLGCAQADVLSEKEKSPEEEPSSTTSDLPDISIQDLDNTVKQVQKLADLTDTKVLQLSVRHALAHKFYGKALKFVQKQTEEKQTKELDKKLIEIYGHLGWDHLARYVQNCQPVKYPTSFRPF
jgi:tripeptidyl-peptidase-2